MWYLCDTSQIPLQYLWDTAVVPLRNLRQIPLGHLWACHTHPQVLLQLDAERCRAMQSDAERCSSDSRKSEGLRKLLPTRSLNQLTTTPYYNVLRKKNGFFSLRIFMFFSRLSSLLKYYSSTRVMHKSVTSLYMCELVVQVSLIFVNEIQSTLIFCILRCFLFFEFVEFLEILFINHCHESISYKPVHVWTCGPTIIDFR